MNRAPKLNLSMVIGYHNAQHEDHQLKVAGIRPRLLAFMFDVFFLTLMVRLILALFSAVMGYDFINMPTELGLFIAWTTVFIYFVVPQYLTGQTLGKRIVKIKVIHQDEYQNINFIQFIAREVFGKFVSIITFGIGFMLVLTREDRRALHDLMSRTRVVDLKKNRSNYPKI
tara:strand:- start:42180 stop:42692 length:513 start_codon:yes stop_codon:yes gene_type:complete